MARAGKGVLAQRFGGFPDLAFARKEDQHVARAAAHRFIDRVEDRLLGIAFRLVLVFGFRFRIIRAANPAGRAVAYFDRIQPARYLDYGSIAKMRGETLRIDRGGGDDELEISAPGQQLLEIAEQEIDIEAALVRFIDNDRIVCQQLRIALGFCQQDAVGHELDVRIRTHLIGKAHLVAYRAS